MKVVKRLFAVLATMTAVFAFGICVSAMEAPVTVPSAYAGSTVAPTTFSVTYTESEKVEDYYAGKIYPIVVTEPAYIEYTISVGTIQENIRFGLYSDAACTTSVGYIGAISAGGTTGGTGIIGIKTPGTYYFKAYSYSGSYNQEAYTNSVNVSMALYTISDKTIAKGQSISYYNAASESTICFKYTAKTNGLVTVKYSDVGYGDVFLANASKKVITDEVYISNNYNSTATFAVKKGQTYYICSDVYDSDEKLTISVTEKKVKEKSGKKMKKAVKIKGKKKKTGLIINGEKKSDWYKITIKKTKALNFYFTYEGTGYVRIEAFDGKGKSLGYKTQTSKDGRQEYYIEYGYNTKKAAKGTYYIKVSRYNEETSGGYTIKLK